MSESAPKPTRQGVDPIAAARLLDREPPAGYRVEWTEYLAKPARLSAQERAIIKCHTEVGYEILKNIPFPWPVADIVYQHHEHLDGSGYPRGIMAKEILLEAKILTVADVVEAMSSHRPYRPSLGVETALDEIRSGRGVLYHAESVDACLRLIAEKRVDLSAVAW